MDIEVIEINLDDYPELKAQLEAIDQEERDAGVRYCDCKGAPDDPSYAADGCCNCPIHKHHWHCNQCGGVYQIG